MWLGKTLFLPSDFKTKSFEKFILWKIAARKIDFAASEQQRHSLANNKGTDQTVMMSKPVYLSVEIVTDNPTLGKISIPQLVSVAEQNELSLTWSQPQYLCQHACVLTPHAHWCYLQTFNYINFY